jgi:hypothetical protein
MMSMKSLKILFASIATIGLAFASPGGSTNQLESPFNKLRGQTFVVDPSDIRVVTWSYKVMPEDSLATIEVFTRGGQTNMVRQTHTKDGVVLLRSHSFYHDGTEAGGYSYMLGNGTKTVVGSNAGSPYYFDVDFDASNQALSAQIRAANGVLLDWFLCTNGVFYPADSSLIQKARSWGPKNFPQH